MLYNEYKRLMIQLGRALERAICEGRENVAQRIQDRIYNLVESFPEYQND